MPGELIRLVDEETAKAVQEVAKLASKIVDAAAGSGRYIDRVLGRVPEDLVGYLVGDWLAERRTRRAERLRAKTEEIRRRRGTQEKVEPSPSIAIPLIQAAIDEDREELSDLWAHLLAAAMDPNRRNLVRLEFIEVVKKMDPLDVPVLTLGDRAYFGNIAGDTLNQLAKRLDVSRDQIDVSVSNLVKLGLAARPNTSSTSADAVITPLGRELLRAVSD
jgi:hypothetical protein